MSNPKWLQIALMEQGQTEIPGSVDNARILEYFTATDYPKAGLHDEVPWCAAFANWCLGQAGFTDARGRPGATRSAAAKSFKTWGQALDKPVLGCLVVWDNHVTFYQGEQNGRILGFGGNQGNSVRTSSYAKGNAVYRWPSDVPLPNAVAPLSKSGVIRGNIVAGLGTVGTLGAGLIGNADTVDKARAWIAEGGWIGLALGVIVLAGIIWSIASRVQGKQDAAAAQ